MMEKKHLFISYRRDGALNQQWAERVDARLNEHGFKVWRDVDGIQPGERWTDKIPPAIEQSALVLCIVSESLLESEWVDAELNFAQNRKQIIVPVRIEEDYRPPFLLSGVQQFDLYTNNEDAWNKLFELVGRHVSEINDEPKPVKSQRQRELEYLDRLLYSGKQVARLTPIYTELASHFEHKVKNLADALPADLIPASFLHQSTNARKKGKGERYDDILKVFASYDQKTPCLALLGEPGAGKSFSLRRLSALKALQAQEDSTAAIPLLVELGDWIEDVNDQPFEEFLRNALKPLDADLNELLATGRAFLLLDALNELPTAQQSEKIKPVKKWIKDQRLAGIVISCRQRDFTDDLKLDINTVTIEPLDPTSIYQFVQRYLAVIDPDNAKTLSEKLFWQLATGHSDNNSEIESAKRIWQRLLDKGFVDFRLFWEVSRNLPFGYKKRKGLELAISTIEKDHSSLLKLAEIPYLLNILVGLFLEDKLPEPGEGRAKVFTRFVEDLLLRERKRYQKTTDDLTPPGEAGLLDALGELAWNLQRASHQNQQESVQTRLPESSVQMSLSESQLNHAIAANLLQVSSQQVNFIHQLLQEYFAALGLKKQIETNQLPAESIWSNHDWWKSTGWEETVITVASYFSDDLTPLIEWLGDVNPELLADSLVFNGLFVRENALLQQKITDWIQRMTDQEREPNPESRAAIGRALAKLQCDSRPGVGVKADGFPDIDWVEISGGEFLYGEDKDPLSIEGFYMARYPITNAQYDAFVTDNGYDNEHWWQELPERIDKPQESEWKQGNLPRESVSWYEAIAYCRWLSVQLGYNVSLATERQWERAARGTDGREYPWGDEYQSGYANINEIEKRAGPNYLKQTSPVGMYDFAGSPEGIQDLSGNVWEWVLNEYEGSVNASLKKKGRRVLCGGSWVCSSGFARASSRNWFNPANCHDVIGFRIVCSSPIAR